jgi:type II secretory pathway pseudopilin PulG
MELMVVIAVILFLSQLLIPKLMDYFSRARSTEVHINLGSLYTAQCAYQMSHGRFTSDLRTAGWQPNGYHADETQRKNYYTYGCLASESQEGVHVFTGSAGTPSSALGTGHADGTTFEAHAALTKDGKTTVWKVDEEGRIEEVTI